MSENGNEKGKKGKWGGRRTPGPGKSLGRPPLPRDEKKTRRWIFLRRETWAELDDLAEEAGESVSQLLQRWLDEDSEPD